MAATKIELSRVISVLRSELLQARKEGNGQDLRFNVEEAEVELQVGVTAGVDGTTGVSFWVFTAEAGGKLEHETLQKITLKLRPLDADGGTFATSGSASRP